MNLNPPPTVMSDPGLALSKHLQDGEGTPTALRLVLHTLLAQPADRHDLLLDLTPNQYRPLWQLLAPEQAHWLCRTLLLLQKTAERAQLRGALGTELGQLLHDAALARWAELPLGSSQDEASLLRAAIRHLAVYTNLPAPSLLQRLYQCLSTRQRQCGRMGSRLLALAEETRGDLPYVVQERPNQALQQHHNGLLVQLAAWLSHAPASAQIDVALRRNWVETLLVAAPDALARMLRDLAGVHWQAALVACLSEQQLERLLVLLQPDTGMAYLSRPNPKLPQIERQLAWCRVLRQALRNEGDLLSPRSQSSSFQLRLFLRYGAWPASLSRSGATSLASWLANLPDAVVIRELALIGPAAARQVAYLSDHTFLRRCATLLLGEQAQDYLTLLELLPLALAQAGLDGQRLQLASQHASAQWLASLLVRGTERPAADTIATTLAHTLALRFSLPEQTLRNKLKSAPGTAAQVASSAPITLPAPRPITPPVSLPLEGLARYAGAHVHC